MKFSDILTIPGIWKEINLATGLESACYFVPKSKNGCMNVTTGFTYSLRDIEFYSKNDEVIDGYEWILIYEL